MPSNDNTDRAMTHSRALTIPIRLAHVRDLLALAAQATDVRSVVDALNVAIKELEAIALEIGELVEAHRQAVAAVLALAGGTNA